MTRRGCSARARTAAAALCMTVFCGCAGPDAGKRAETAAGTPWAEQIRQVRPGMSRAEVETLLPPYLDTVLPIRCRTFQCVKYWVDPMWLVTIAYDFTGATYDDKGNVVIMGSPRNKVIAPVAIEHRTYGRLPPP